MIPIPKLIVLILLLLPSLATSAEIDSITPGKTDLKDSLEPLNEIINTRLQEGVKQANRTHNLFSSEGKEKYCNEIILYRELRKAIFGSSTISLGLKGYGLDKQFRSLFSENSSSLPLEKSIYRDITYLEGFSLNFKELSDVVNIKGHLVGLDKIGHFFAEGWSYFEMTSTEDSTLYQAMQWGWEREEGRFGYTTTGIFSYADLVANFNGWRFWNNILHKEEDPLQGVIANFFATPYIKCGIRILDSLRSRSLIYGWTTKKKFDLMEYLDGTWDERNNCVGYKNKEIEDKVTSRIRAVAPHFSCPVSKEECKVAKTRYGSRAEKLLHPACLIAGE